MDLILLNILRDSFGPNVVVFFFSNKNIDVAPRAYDSTWWVTSSTAYTVTTL